MQRTRKMWKEKCVCSLFFEYVPRERVLALVYCFLYACVQRRLTMVLYSFGIFTLIHAQRAHSAAHLPNAWRQTRRNDEHDSRRCRARKSPPCRPFGRVGGT